MFPLEALAGRGRSTSPKTTVVDTPDRSPDTSPDDNKQMKVHSRTSHRFSWPSNPFTGRRIPVVQTTTTTGFRTRSETCPGMHRTRIKHK